MRKAKRQSVENADNTCSLWAFQIPDGCGLAILAPIRECPRRSARLKTIDVHRNIDKTIAIRHDANEVCVAITIHVGNER